MYLIANRIILLRSIVKNRFLKKNKLRIEKLEELVIYSKISKMSSLTSTLWISLIIYLFISTKQHLTSVKVQHVNNCPKFYLSPFK